MEARPRLVASPEVAAQKLVFWWQRGEPLVVLHPVPGHLERRRAGEAARSEYIAAILAGRLFQALPGVQFRPVDIEASVHAKRQSVHPLS